MKNILFKIQQDNCFHPSRVSCKGLGGHPRTTPSPFQETRLGQGMVKCCLLLLLAFLLFTGNLSAQAMPVQKAVSLEEQFTLEELSFQQMNTFQQRGNQKVQEFSELVNLISNPELDLTFRKEAKNMAQNLFYANNANLKVFDFKTQTIQDLTLKNYLQNLLNNETNTFQLELKTLDNAQFSNFNAGQSTWTLSYLQTMTAPNGNTQQLTGKMEVLLKKVNKAFGEENRRVWEVLLGDVQDLKMYDVASTKKKK